MQLNFKKLDLQLAHKWTIARTSGTNIFKVLVVEITSPYGTVGMGEASPVMRYNESVDTVETFCKRVDPSRLTFHDVAGSMRYLDTLSTGDMAAKCALNIALLDGAARLASKPIYDYLGLGFRDHHHISSFTIGIDTPDMIRQKVLEAENYPVLKVKVGVPEDRVNLQALREVAPDKLLRVDANEGWKTKEQALEMIEWLATDKAIQYVEQPMPAATPAAEWVWLKKRSPLPIFADESYHTVHDLSRVADCFHGVNVKLVKSAGISGGLEALQAARKAGLRTMIGCMIETSILISAAAHLAELCDYLDVDGNVLITNDPYVGVSNQDGLLFFNGVPEPHGLRVQPR